MKEGRRRYTQMTPQIPLITVPMRIGKGRAIQNGQWCTVLVRMTAAQPVMPAV